jgi:hypothetical protein
MDLAVHARNFIANGTSAECAAQSSVLLSFDLAGEYLPSVSRYHFHPRYTRQLLKLSAGRFHLLLGCALNNYLDFKSVVGPPLQRKIFGCRIENMKLRSDTGQCIWLRVARKMKCRQGRTRGIWTICEQRGVPSIHVSGHLLPRFAS